MLTAYASRNDRLEPVPPADLDQAVWIDLNRPTPDEAARVESCVGVHLPTQEEMAEIELSSRLYEQDDARFMTVTALVNLADRPVRTPLTFVLKGNVLVSIRHADLKTFEGYATRATRSKAGPCQTGGAVLLALLEAVTDRLADALETVGADIDSLSREIFRPRRGREKAQGRDLEALISEIGHQGETIDMIQESMVSIGRAASFMTATEDERSTAAGHKRVAMIQRDAEALGEHAIFLSDKINFLLDATLGLINLEQNKVMKIFSIVSVVFMPPTLVASIYGMNFDRMPELHWTFGYPFALILMTLFAVVPFLVFRRKGWL